MPPGGKPGLTAQPSLPADAAPAAEQPPAPKAFAKDVLPPGAGDQKKEVYENESAGRRSQRQLQRYADRLEKQQAAQQQEPIINFSMGVSRGDAPAREPAMPNAGPATPTDMPVGGDSAGTAGSRSGGRACRPDTPPGRHGEPECRPGSAGPAVLVHHTARRRRGNRRAVSAPLLGRLLRLTGLVAGLLGLLVVTRRLRQLRRGRLASGMPTAHTS